MPTRVVILVSSMLAAAALAAVLVWATASGHLKNTCAYGSGNSRNSCKSRPEPRPEELASAIDASALAAAMAAFRRSPDGGALLLGVGMNRWGEVTFALPTGKTGFGVARERFVRFDARGQPLDENRQAQYEDTAGTIPFAIDMVRPEVLRASLARVDRPVRFNGARLEPSFGNNGLAWRLTYATRGVTDAQGALFAMAADGTGICRLNDSSSSPEVPSCNLARLPATPFPGEPVEPDAPMAMPTPDPALAKQFEQMACVKNAQGDVAALRRCVE